MAKLYYQSDCQREYLVDKTVAIIGFGSQGRAHALNLRIPVTMLSSACTKARVPGRRQGRS